MSSTLIRYQTADEISYLRALACRHRWAELQSTLDTLHQRDWSQPGMSVDVEKIRLTLEVLLEGKPR